jgi:hypothetical protein
VIASMDLGRVSADGRRVPRSGGSRCQREAAHTLCIRASGWAARIRSQGRIQAPR